MRELLDRHDLLDCIDGMSFSEASATTSPSESSQHALAGLGVVIAADAAHVGGPPRIHVAGAIAMRMTAVRYNRVYNDDAVRTPEPDIVVADLAELPLRASNTPAELMTNIAHHDARRTATASAAELLRHEAEAIATAADRLNADGFSVAVEILVGCTGTVATIGTGTSGIVARKIAATLTSTGTPALFVHPSDALHGGLGLIGRQEVVIAVSNSGETEEILALLPYVRSRDVKVIAIVGNLRSTLAREAEVALDAFAEREAGPHGLVPTASVAVALAIGDALALTVMDEKGVTRDAFAANHPSGRLGRRLTLRVCDVMHSGSEHPTIAVKAPLLEVVTAITSGGLGAVNVIDDEDRLLGVITDGDVRRTLQRCDPSELAQRRAADVMTAEPVVIRPDAMAYEALEVMENRPSQIAVLPVVDSGRCVGLVRLHDLMRIGL